MATHREVAKILQSHGFKRLQGSGHNWFCEPADAVDVFWSMLSLTGVRPPGKFQSTVKELKAHHIHGLALDITPQIRLGGEYSPTLQGLTPAGLVPPSVPSRTPPVPPPSRDTLGTQRKLWLLKIGESHLFLVFL